MSQIIEAFEKYLRCVKLDMPRVVRHCIAPKIGLMLGRCDSKKSTYDYWIKSVTKQ